MTANPFLYKLSSRPNRRNGDDKQFVLRGRKDLGPPVVLELLRKPSNSGVGSVGHAEFAAPLAVENLVPAYVGCSDDSGRLQAKWASGNGLIGHGKTFRVRTGWST